MSHTILYAATLGHGSAWDHSQPIEGQELWPEHRDFMNAMEDEGFIVLGGPLGDGAKVLLVFDADSEDQIRSRLARDPWHVRDLLIHREGRALGDPDQQPPDGLVGGCFLIDCRICPPPA